MPHFVRVAVRNFKDIFIMRSNKLIFTVLYFLGLLLCISLFVTFVPSESRTNVKWMNLCIGLFVYSGLWGKYSLLYSKLGQFSDNVPALSLYWVSFGSYVVASAVAMILFLLFKVEFEKQAILQGVLLFAFIVFIAIGIGASNFMTGESARSQAQIDGVRAIQFKVRQLKITLVSLTSEYSYVRSVFDKVAEDVMYLCGSNNPKSREMESQILLLCDKLQMQINAKCTSDECLATISALSTVISLRKTISNI